jgi:hypothetical protein
LQDVCKALVISSSSGGSSRLLSAGCYGGTFQGWQGQLALCNIHFHHSLVDEAH